MNQTTASATDVTVTHLLLDLLAWIAERPKPYADVLDAWRTSCPRLPVWEEALDRGFVERTRSVAGDAAIRVTDTGLAFLAENGREATRRERA